MCVCDQLYSSADVTLQRTHTVFQVHVPRDLHSGDDNQVGCQGLHPQQVHVPAEPLELARLRRHHVRLRHHRHGGWQLGGAADLPRAAGPQDCLHHARYGSLVLWGAGGGQLVPASVTWYEVMIAE